MKRRYKCMLGHLIAFTNRDLPERGILKGLIPLNIRVQCIRANKGR